MSTGLKTLRKLIEEGDVPSFHQLNLSLFDEEEQPVYLFVHDHVNSYNRLPTVETCGENGHNLPTASENAAYWLNRIKLRKAFEEINDRFAGFRAAMRQKDPIQARDCIREMLGAVDGCLAVNSFSSLDQIVHGVLDDYHIAKEEMGLRGITLGYPTLNEMTLGAQGGDLIVMAARTGMGKTWSLLRMAYAAWADGKNIGFMSMEMTLVPIGRRFVGIHSGLNPNFIRAGQLTQWGEQRLVESINEMHDAAGTMNFLAGDFEKSIGAIEDFINQYQPQALYIDAAYLLSPAGNKRGYISRWEQIAQVIKELKQLALRYNIPLIVSVQLNRNVKKGSNRELDASDVAGADSIPQDASILIGQRLGPTPFERTRRIHQVVKNRDGEEEEYQVYHEFAPVRLDEAPPVTVESIVEEMTW